MRALTPFYLLINVAAHWTSHSHFPGNPVVETLYLSVLHPDVIEAQTGQENEAQELEQVNRYRFA